MQYIAIMDAFIDDGLGEVRMGGQRSTNLKKYENKGDYKDFRIGWFGIVASEALKKRITDPSSPSTNSWHGVKIREP